MSEIWIDAQLPPSLAIHITRNFPVKAIHLYELSLHTASDTSVFKKAAKSAGVIILTKDEDFVELINRHKSPPKIIWLTIGNCSNARLKEFILKNLNDALKALENDDLVELSNLRSL